MTKLATCWTLSLVVPVLLGCSDDERADGTTSATGSSGSPTGTGATGGGSDAGGGDSGGGGAGMGGAGGAPPGVPYVYVGQSDGEIAWFSLDAATGALAPLGSISAGNYPSFLAVDPQHRFLYAALEASDQVAAFAIDAATGALTPLGSPVSSTAGGPAHVSVDGSGKWVLVANYGGGSVAVLPVNADGSLAEAVDTASPGDNAHMIRTDPSNQFAFVPCKGSDLVAQFHFDATSGALSPNTPTAATSPGGAGPRHLDFHPTAPFVYVVNELDVTVTTCAFDTAAGTLSMMESVPALPTGVTIDGNSGADIHVRPDGKFLYSSNRGHDSIAIFAIDTASGELSLVGHQPTGGSTPRNFGLDPAGELLLVGNQKSNAVAVFRIDANAGTLTSLGTTPTTGEPHWVGVVTLLAR